MKGIYYIILSLCLLFLLISSSYCQEFKKSVYVELGGNNLIYSINYEQNLLNTSSVHFNPRIGFGTTGLGFLGFPVEANLLVGKKKHFFEASAGVTFQFGIGKELKSNGTLGDKKWDSDNYFVGRLGYRYSSEKGFLFRIAFTPFYHDYVLPWAGISIGKSFK